MARNKRKTSKKGWICYRTSSLSPRHPRGGGAIASYEYTTKTTSFSIRLHNGSHAITEDINFSIIFIFGNNGMCIATSNTDSYNSYIDDYDVGVVGANSGTLITIPPEICPIISKILNKQLEIQSGIPGVTYTINPDGGVTISVLPNAHYWDEICGNSGMSEWVVAGATSEMSL